MKRLIDRTKRLPDTRSAAIGENPSPAERRIPMRVSLSMALAAIVSALFVASAEAQYPAPYPTPPSYGLTSLADEATEPGLLEPTATTNDLWSGNQATASGCDSCGDKNCGGKCRGRFWGLGCCFDRCGCWSATVGGLYLRRDRPNDQWLSFDTADINSHLLSTRDADTKWNDGVEVRLRRELACNRALELVYWGRFHDSATATVTDAAAAGDLNTTMNMSNVFFSGGGSEVVDWFDDADQHTITRDLEFHNVEFNLLHHAIYSEGCGAANLSWYGGLRFFRVDDGLLYSSVAGAAGGPGGTATAGGTASLDLDTENNLIGVQIGALGEYFVTDSLSLNLGGNIGLYGNDINQRFRVNNTDGETAYDIRSSKTDVSFLAQIDLGGSWYVGNRWRLFTGYRAVAVTGLALTDDQLPTFLADADGIADIDSGSSMILHGGYMGAEFTF